MNWLIWGLLLVVQNFSFTLVSRARNSGSIGYHAIAAIFSNGVWFASQIIIVQNVVEIVKRASWLYGAAVLGFYTACTLIGSLSSHYVTMHFIERGKRAVGAAG